MKRFALLAALVVAPGAASAQLVDEFRFGALAHDIGLFGGTHEDGIDINAEARFASPGFLKFLFAPRPHFGISANTAGDTSQVYFGLTWTVTLFRSVFLNGDSLFVDGSLGGAVHNGELDTNELGKKSLGSRILFRESLELGWAFTPNQSISLMLDHISNANLGERNEGLDNVGIRYGLKF